VFAQAREKARQTACLSDVKQLGLSFAQYEQDYDEMTPCGYKSTGGGQGWAGQIYPYVKSEKVYVCPSDPTKKPICSYAYNTYLGPLVPGSNPMYSTGVLISQFAAPAKTILLAEVINSGCNSSYTIPNEMTQMLHASPVGRGNGVDYDPGGYSGGLTSAQAVAALAAGTCFVQYATGITRMIRTPSVDVAQFASVDGQHQTGSCYLFADNHAKWLKPSQVAGGYTNDGSQRPCGNAGYGEAPSTICTDTTIVGTWSYK
jgi:hypothetical protein